MLSPLTIPIRKWWLKTPPPTKTHPNASQADHRHRCFREHAFTGASAAAPCARLDVNIRRGRLPAVPDGRPSRRLWLGIRMGFVPDVQVRHEILLRAPTIGLSSGHHEGSS